MELKKMMNEGSYLLYRYSKKHMDIDDVAFLRFLMNEIYKKTSMILLRTLWRPFVGFPLSYSDCVSVVWNVTWYVLTVTKEG